MDGDECNRGESIQEIICITQLYYWHNIADNKRYLELQKPQMRFLLLTMADSFPGGCRSMQATQKNFQQQPEMFHPKLPLLV